MKLTIDIYHHYDDIGSAAEYCGILADNLVELSEPDRLSLRTAEEILNLILTYIDDTFEDVTQEAVVKYYDEGDNNEWH